MKTLYKLDSKKKIRVWRIIASEDELIQESGLLDGKLVVHSKVCTPKNIGKSNETTSQQQAISEMESLIKDKLTEGYFETVKDAENEVVILPMLAKSYKDEKHKIDWSTTYIQPKLDGQRCLAVIKNGIVKLISRDGKIIENMDHIIKELSTIKEDIILDGELYAHELSFQENMKLIKKLRPNTSKLIKYHVYDLISNECFTDRFTKLDKIVDLVKNVILIENKMLNSENELGRLHQLNLSNNYEGSIIRWGHEGYKINGRSSNLLKFKDFLDIDLPIIDILPNDAISIHGTPVFELNGKSFKAGCKLSHADREDLLINKAKYIGQIATITYFEKTDEGLLRFPVFKGIRSDLNK